MRRRSRGPAVGLLLTAGLVLGAPAPAAAQRAEAAFTLYGVADGLSQASANALLQDSAGFIWVGTQDGLNRFDGIGFRAFRTRSDDTTSLRDDDVASLALADSGRIWVGGRTGGLQRFDPLTETATSYPLTDVGPQRADDAHGPGRQVARIVTRPGGDLLLRTNVGLVRFQPKTGEAVTLVPTDNGPAPHVKALGSERDGEAIVGLSDGSWAKVGRDGDLKRAGPVLPDSATEVAVTAGGLVTVTFDGVIYEFDLDHTSYREVARLPRDDGASPVTRDLLVDTDGMLWLATQVGAFTVDLRSGAVSAVGSGESARGLPDPDVGALLVDRTGILWVGTWNGLASLNPLATRIGRRLAPRDIDAGGVIAMAEAPGGGLWLGTYGGGLQLLRRGRRGSVVHPPSTAPLAGADIFGLAAGGGDTLYVAAYSAGVWRVVGDAPAERITTVGADGSEASPTAYSVLRDHAGQVWAGTLELGLVRLDRATDRFIPFRGEGRGWGLGPDWVWPLAEDSHGRLWMGARAPSGGNGGLSMVSADRKTTRLYQAGPGGLSGNVILTVYVDSRDRVWVGTQGDGLDRLDPETGNVVSWTTENGLPHDHVEGIVEDAHGEMWITTNDGLARLDPETGKIRVFHRAAGLAGDRFFANGAHRSPNGTLYFGGPDGLTILDPDVITESGAPPRAALTAFRIQGREVHLDRAERTDELVLQPDENFFAFEFAAMDFADVSRNRYRYRLEGLDPDWVDAGSTPVANYTSVPPAHYVFRVAARNSEGVWNDDALVVPIRVRAHYYKTAWFRSLVLVGVLAMVAGLYTYRLRQLEARQRLRLEIAGKLHDDIGANLSNIALKADMVRSTSSLDDRRAAILGDVGRLARDTAHKVRETVWVVNTRYDTLPKLVGHMHDTADTLLSGHVEYSFADPSECPDLRVSMEFRQNVYLLFKEAVNNVVKHAQATRVDIAVSVDQRMLTFRVKDDGVGFEPAGAGNGNGQDLMRRRASQAHGRLDVRSAPRHGTNVEFSARIR